MVKLYAIGLVGAIGASEVIAVVRTELFRPIKFYTDVTRAGLATVHDIWFGNSVSGSFLGSIDAWEFSTFLVQQRRAEFFKAHQLEGKPSDFIDLYLEENGLSLPDVPPIYSPTLRKDDNIKLTGQFNTRCAFSIFGYC